MDKEKEFKLNQLRDIIAAKMPPECKPAFLHLTTCPKCRKEAQAVIKFFRDNGITEFDFLKVLQSE